MGSRLAGVSHNEVAFAFLTDVDVTLFEPFDGDRRGRGEVPA